MVEELESVDRALFSRLDSDTALKAYMGGTLRLYSDEVPQGTALPYLVMTLMSALPHDTVGSSDHFLVNAVYLVKAITAGGSYVTSSAMMGRVWELLRNYKVQTVSPAFYIAVSSRTGRVRYTETAEGKTYKHNGAMYRIWISEA